METAQESENYGAGQAPKSKRKLWIASVIVVILVVTVGVVVYVIMTNKPKGDTSAAVTTVPQVPSKEEVGQLMASLDDKIDQAVDDQASASAAINEASTPLKVDF